MGLKTISWHLLTAFRVARLRQSLTELCHSSWVRHSYNGLAEIIVFAVSKRSCNVYTAKLWLWLSLSLLHPQSSPRFESVLTNRFVRKQAFVAAVDLFQVCALVPP